MLITQYYGIGDITSDILVNQTSEVLYVNTETKQEEVKGLEFVQLNRESQSQSKSDRFTLIIFVIVNNSYYLFYHVQY